MFGYEKAEVQDAIIDLIIPPAYRQRHRRGYESFLRHIADRSTYISETKEFEGLRKNGEIFPVQLTHSLYKINDQEFYITATIRDISIFKRYEPSGKVRLKLLKNEAGIAVLEIYNGGNPIPEEIQKVLFQPYVTCGKKSGSGLGLYTVKLIIEKVHGWQLTFESNGKKVLFSK